MKKIDMFLGFVASSSFLLAVQAFADPSAPVPAPSILSGAVNAVNGIASHVPSSVPMWLVGVIPVVSELLLRVIPTAKPKSLLLLVSAAFNGAGALFGAVAALFVKGSQFLDQFCQNLIQ